MPARSKVRFGHFTVDLSTRELFGHGRKIPLQRKPYQILTLLLERPGELMSREELRRKLWPADTFVDFEHNINTAIRKLREALGDDCHRPRYVDTIPGFGYRFQEPIKWINSARKRLAVLPLENLNRGDADWFTLGLTELLIAELGRTCRNLDVIAPAFVMHYKNGESARAICSELNADYLLAGSVLRFNGTVRIIPKLIRGEDQCCVWTEAYTRKQPQVLALQSEIAARIAQALTHFIPTPGTRLKIGTAGTPRRVTKSL